MAYRCKQSSNVSKEQKRCLATAPLLENGRGLIGVGDMSVFNPMFGSSKPCQT